MISVIIATYKEEKTIDRAVRAFLDEGIREIEILVISPDQETLNAVKKNPRVKLIKEEKKSGKPAALNLALKKVNKKSKILVLSDGDVVIEKNSLKFLLEHFKDKRTGAVSGNPVSKNNRGTKYGLWSFMLTSVANKRRIKAAKEGKRFFCSGYLFAIRRELFPDLPEELLSEDGFISHNVYENGFRIAYEERARVHVKFPTNFPDWINQKKRGIGGYNQMKKMLNVEIRSFKRESLGFSEFLKYPSNLREIYWLFSLFLARVYVWAMIYRDVNLRKRPREELWTPVDSTK